MPPVIAPIVQVKLLDIEAAKPILGLVPLQIVAVLGVVTVGFGLTDTVIVKGTPAHEPVVDVGVTIYSTVPTSVLLGLVNIWLMVEPDPAPAPVIPPMFVPIVQLKLLGALEVSTIFGLVPPQMVAAGELVTMGVGLTVTVIV